MTRKFKFLGYGNRVPTQADEYEDMNSDTEYWFDSIVLTVGKIYEALSINTGYSLPDDAQFIDDEGTPMTQELRFFEEVFEDAEMENDGVSPKDLAIMDASAEELRLQFEG